MRVFLVVLSVLVSSTISQASEFSCTVTLDEIKSEPFVVKTSSNPFNQNDVASFTLESPINGKLKGRVMLYDVLQDPRVTKRDESYPAQLLFISNIDHFSWHKMSTRRYKVVGKVKKYRSSRIQVTNTVPYDSQYFSVSVSGIWIQCSK